MVYFLCTLGYFMLIYLNYYKSKCVNIVMIHNVMWLFLSTAVLVYDLPMSEKAFVFIFLNSAVFMVGYAPYGWRKKWKLSPRDNDVYRMKRNDEKERENEIRIRIFDKINFYLITINIIGILYLGYSLGFSLGTFWNLNELMTKMNAISNMRYGDNIEVLPEINRLINAVSYGICSYCGFYFSSKKKPQYLICLFIFSLQTILTNTKATVIFAFAFWLAGLLVGLEFNRIKISLKMFGKIIGIIVVVFFFSVTINYFRHAGSIPFIEESEKILVSYFIGPTSAFSEWLEMRTVNDWGLGENTFSSLFRVSGIIEQQHGEFVIIGGIMTNVYTIYKHLISDFGTLITLLISLVIGFIASIIDVKIKNREYRYVGLGMLLLVAILVSFFSSLFRYTTNIVACILISLYPIIRINRKFNREK